jgi:hypothetical protein
MITLTERTDGLVTLRAPGAGIVRFHAPRALCGELEVFEAGETIADVGGIALAATARGFVVRALAGEGSLVDDNMPLVIFRTA